jgi:hypothetical protein
MKTKLPRKIDISLKREFLRSTMNGRGKERILSVVTSRILKNRREKECRPEPVTSKDKLSMVEV